MMSQLDKTGFYTNKFIEFVGLGHETQVPAGQCRGPLELEKNK